jgi:hypothetical protein
MFDSNKQIKDIILNTSIRYLNEYISLVVDLHKEYGVDIDVTKYYDARITYLKIVSDSIFDYYNNVAPLSNTVYINILTAFEQPLYCGYNLNADANFLGMNAGKVYAIVYWANENKFAKERDLINISVQQDELIRKNLDLFDKGIFYSIPNPLAYNFRPIAKF